MIDWSGKIINLKKCPDCKSEAYDCFAYCKGKCIALEQLTDEDCAFYKTVKTLVGDEWLETERERLYGKGGFIESVTQRQMKKLAGGTSDWDL